MDTQQLLTLQRLGKEKSFSRASRELGVSQPTVTTRIRALEEELGENLVLRTGHKAILTPAGEILLQYADRVCKIYQAALDRLSFRGEMIVVAATSVFNTYVLPQILSPLREKAKDIRWSFLTGSSIDIAQMVKDEIADIGIIRGTIEDEDLCCRVLYAEQFHLIVPSGHPFTSTAKVTFRDLQNERLLIYRRSSDTYRLIVESFLHAGVKPNISMELEHVISVKQMIMAGMGIGFLPAKAVRAEIEAGRLAIVKLDEAQLFREVSLLTPRRSLSATTEVVVPYLIETLKQEPRPREP